MHALPSYFGLLFHPLTWIVVGLILIALLRKPIGKVAVALFFVVWDKSKRVARWWRNTFGGGNA